MTREGVWVRVAAAAAGAGAGAEVAAEVADAVCDEWHKRFGERALEWRQEYLAEALPLEEQARRAEQVSATLDVAGREALPRGSRRR